MKSPLESLFRTPVSIMESGLLTMNAALGMMQTTVAAMTGQRRPEPLKSPPLEGPKDIDGAVSDYANRLARIARFTPWDSSEFAAASQEILAATRQSFGDVNLGGVRNVAFRRCASSIAHRNASFDSSDPSTPTTMSDISASFR